VINWIATQPRLNVKADGQPGPVTYTALLSHVALRSVPSDAGAALAKHASDYGVDANVNRLAAFAYGGPSSTTGRAM